MSNDTCNVCMEKYNRNANPAMTLVPCGHNFCKPCIEIWRRNNNSCPECRRNIINLTINRGLMDVIETSNNSSTNLISVEKFCQVLSKEKDKEVLSDKCTFAFYVIDNSGSMGHYNDGKIFVEDEKGIINKISGLTRWNEAVDKVKSISDYNINRGMKSVYYLLNPHKKNNWVEDYDFVSIDPESDDIDSKINSLDRLLSSDNVYGSTPLHSITRHINNSLGELINSDVYKNKPICYNLITDGEPDYKFHFESELNNLAKKYNVFLVINLCTDNDDIVQYYNDLDKNVGKEMSGMDVIDDMEAEYKEIRDAGNRFFSYSKDIHVCRMSGCFNIVADLMDEEYLHVHHVIKLTNELLFNRNENILVWEDTSNYIQLIKNKLATKEKVYDIYYRKSLPIINVSNLESILNWYKIKISWENFYNDNYLIFYGSIFLLLIVLIYTL